MSHVFTVCWHQQSAVMEAMQQLFEKLTSAEGRLDQGKLSEHKSDIAAVDPFLPPCADILHAGFTHLAGASCELSTVLIA